MKNRVGDAVACGFEAFCSRSWRGREDSVDPVVVANNLVSWYAQTIGPWRFVWLYADERSLAGRILAGMIQAHLSMLRELPLGVGVPEVVVECGSLPTPSLIVREYTSKPQPVGGAVPDNPLLRPSRSSFGGGG